jgi:hypothetical protein
MAEIIGDLDLDNNLHHAIDLLQAMVLNLEVLKQQPEIAGTNLVRDVNALTNYAFECGNLLHEARAGNQDIVRSCRAFQ